MSRIEAPVPRKKNAALGVNPKRPWAKDGELIGTSQSKFIGGLDQLFSRSDQCAKSFSQQASVERLLKRFVDC